MKDKWTRCDEQLPELKTLYFISDGKNVALAKFDAEGMRWHFLWHYSTFKPTHMIKVSLPKKD